MGDLVEGFVEYCRAKGLTQHTIETYRSNVRTFLQACKKPLNVKLDGLKGFLAELRAQDKAASTLKGYFAAINAFYDYLAFSGAMSSNPVIPFWRRYLARLRTRGECRQLISVEDMRLLISSIHDILDQALIMVLAKTGMRRGELLLMKVENLDFRNNIIWIPETAKRTNRTAFIDGELAAVLRKYLSWRKERARSEWLWISKHGGRIHKDYPGKVLAAQGAALGLHTPGGPLNQRLTCHCLRHFFTSWLFRAGMNPEYIKWLRGDAVKDAWEIYNHINPEAVRKEYLLRMPGLLGLF